MSEARIPITNASRNQRNSRIGGECEGDHHGGQGQRHEEQRSVEDPPADRPEQPLPEEHGRAEHEQDDDEDQQADRAADERGQLRNGSADLRELGLGEVDVGVDEPPERVPRGSELGTNARRPFGGLRISRGRICGAGVGARVGARVERAGRVLRIVQGLGSR